ncbi:hypothetical protein [Nonomuraea endophytica]|uniref:Uncharacterized protein n=1 Tax=Nonomuraea endophytica TaxID=714136 RepID=A0A7W8ABU9_9ACTN|nr:hypothetical protein [Nonomuraea endophytica]MBB5081903.1 hypothetical protein [Nonomuraea endophytica]
MRSAYDERGQNFAPDLHQGRYERQLGYGRAGQLSSAPEMAFPLCTLRRYGYDGSSNRVRLAVQASEENCPAADDSAAEITTYAYTADGRLNGDGYGYDAGLEQQPCRQWR